jgi:hypothetical protein
MVIEIAPLFPEVEWTRFADRDTSDASPAGTAQGMMILTLAAPTGDPAGTGE